MCNVWEADWIVAPHLAKSLIETSFPQLAPVTVQSFGAGWDNAAFLVNESLVFRFPRRRIAVPLMETEVRLLPWLSEKIPVPIPNPSYVGAPSSEYPCIFAGYALIAGHTVRATRMPNHSRRAMAEPLGKFLAALHSVSTLEALALGATEDPIRRLDPTLHKGTAVE